MAFAMEIVDSVHLLKCKYYDLGLVSASSPKEGGNQADNKAWLNQVEG